MIYVVALVLIAASCSKTNETAPYGLKLNPEVSKPDFERDLPQILEKDTLKAITVYSGTSYFLYRGQPMGYEYEMLKRLADYLDLHLKIVVAKDLNELITMLNRGDGDIISYGLTVTQSRKKYMDFTDYLYLTNQVLVQRKPENWRKMPLHRIQKELISDPIELIGDTVSVRRNSSYFYRLQNLQQEIGGKIHIDTMPGKMATEKIIKMVHEGKIKQTVADKNLAKINASYYPNLFIETPISFSQRIAWAVRKNSPKLKDTLNAWIDDFKDEVDYYVIYNKYFENKRRFRSQVASEFYSMETGKVSPYDSLIQHHAERIGWDWRLLAALVYQESRFDPKARSWASARGLMQLMPATARELGVKDVTDPVQNLRGGSNYLHQMWEKWSTIEDSIDRLKFTIASYNCGYYHMKDAQRLAAAYDAPTDNWDSITNYLLKLSYPQYYNKSMIKYGYVRGKEPVGYVSKIFSRYDRYEELIPESPQDTTIAQDTSATVAGL